MMIALLRKIGAAENAEITDDALALITRARKDRHGMRHRFWINRSAMEPGKPPPNKCVPCWVSQTGGGFLTCSTW